MLAETTTGTFTYEERLASLRATKLQQTREKQELVGAMDHDDWALVLPPAEARQVVRTMGTSGVPITDVLLAGFTVEPNHPSGAFFGPRACGANFRRLLEAHLAYVDTMSSLAGAYMVNFNSYRRLTWDPRFDYSHLAPEHKLYGLAPGIGASQHFCQDLQIGLSQGWGSILDRIRAARRAAPAQHDDFYAGLEDVVLGMQSWISRTADTAQTMATEETDPPVRENLLQLAAMNRKLVTEAPSTFREACQWILWFQMAARMYNGSGSLGRLDLLLWPFYRAESSSGSLSDEEAVFHIACLLLRDTAYIQLGGPDEAGEDATNRLSYLVLEAAHRLRVPANVGICVGRDSDPGLLRRGVEVLLEDRTGIPKFLGIDNTVSGFVRNGYPAALARQRAYSGCHWSAIPGREYTVNDCVKVNLAAVFDAGLREMMADAGARPSTELLWSWFERHLHRAVAVIAEGLDLHLEHMHEVFPELVLDLICHGPIERGLDASHGGVDFYNLCVDAAALATVADSFAAVEQRVRLEGRLSWTDLLYFLDTDWCGQDGERARLMMRSVPRYGSGGSLADSYAERIAQAFTAAVKRGPTPAGYNMIPGLFSWAATIAMGRQVGATPNGRHAGDPISHGANPDPGFRKDGAPTAMAEAIARVQPGYGNTAPMQIDVDPGIARGRDAVENLCALIAGHFDAGGTQINMNVLDAGKVLEAHRDPSRYPDLVVRVTGFSAYFASLSPEFRQLVVDRIVAGN
ncbi:MAG: pyruvate formate lyase family protein [Anaerolineae bacterium]